MIPYGKHFIDDSDIESVVSVLRSTNLTQGPAVSKFEAALSAYVGCKYVVSVSSGTAALHLASLAADTTSSEYAFLSPNTFVATANSAIYSRKKPIFVDINDHGNIDVHALEAALDQNPEPRSLIYAVHFAGMPCDMEAISTLAKKNNSIVIEDAAHALGSSYEDGSMVGSCLYSDLTTFSFHPVKSIASGEGGAVCTNSLQLYQKLIRLRSHGITKGDDEFLITHQSHTSGQLNPWYYEMHDLGFNYRLTDIQAALATSQLSKLDSFIARRRELAYRYDSLFASVNHINPLHSGKHSHSSCHLYVVLIDFEELGISRASFVN